MNKYTKTKQVIEKVKRSLINGQYLYTGHANQRLQEREVTRQEVKQVLMNGHHEKRKDKFRDEFSNWAYAIKGKTIDNRKLRVIVSFDSDGMMIITVIDLGDKR